MAEENGCALPGDHSHGSPASVLSVIAEEGRLWQNETEAGGSFNMIGERLLEMF